MTVRPTIIGRLSSYFFDKVREVHLQMFRNELGMPSMPTYNSLRKFIPTAESTANVNSLFSIDSIWLNMVLGM